MNNDRLQYYREYQGLYQREIADVLGVARPVYTIWENKTKLIPLVHLNSLCNFYKVSMDYLVGLSEIANAKDINYITNLNKVEMGKRLKQIRKENGLSLRDLASLLNTGYSNLGSYERGERIILTSFAYQICKKYNISLDWLCGRTNEKLIK